MQFDLHHMGVVVENIADKREAYLALGYVERTGIVHDPVQTAYVQFFHVPGAYHYLELVAPDGPQSKLAKATKRKQPLHHICYVVNDIFAACHLLQERGWWLVSEPTPAVAFDQRNIAWLASPDLLIVELVERGPEGSL